MKRMTQKTNGAPVQIEWITCPRCGKKGMLDLVSPTGRPLGLRCIGSCGFYPTSWEEWNEALQKRKERERAILELQPSKGGFK
jgi:hypothetical protein